MTSYRGTSATAITAVAVALSVSACGGAGAQPAEPTARSAPERPSMAAQAPRPKRYSTSLYSARVPDWSLVADEQAQEEIVRSKWKKAGENTSVLIDAIPGETEAPTSKAESVRAVVSQRSGYRELQFGPVTLGGREAFRWEFEEDGERRVDYFLQGCGGGYAILGSTRASRFGRYEKTFRAVAQSLDCKEGAQRATEPEQETPRECDSEELQGTLVINSGDVGCDEAREVGSNSRGPNSARGPAGWDCSGFATSLKGSKLSAVEGYSCSRGNDRLSLYSEEGDAATTPDSGSGSGTDSSEDPDPGAAADCPADRYVPPSYGSPGYCAGPNE